MDAQLAVSKRDPSMALFTAVQTTLRDLIHLVTTVKLCPRALVAAATCHSKAARLDL